MDSVDLEVLKRSADWLDAGQRVLLVTVVKTWGSSPRPEGAMLAVRDDGLVVGSVSGGCIEDDIVDRTRARRAMTATKCEVVTYGVSADEARRFGLALRRHDPARARAADARARASARCSTEVEAGRLVGAQARRSPTAAGHAAPGARDRRPDLRRQGADDDPRPALPDAGDRRVATVEVPRADRGRARLPGDVCDPREEYTETWDVPGVALVRTMPDDTVLAMKLDERCAVVALTHDPKLDDLALIEALKSPAFYVGALGSRANNAKRRERLREFDLTDGADRAPARPDRPLHRQPHAARDRRLDPRRDHGGQERRGSRCDPARRHRQGAARRHTGVQQRSMNAGRDAS